MANYQTGNNRSTEKRFSFLIVFSFIVLLSLYFIAIWRDNSFVGESPAERLKSLPYLTWTEIKEKDIGKMGVSDYSVNLSCEGINLYGAKFMDMSGGILHTVSAFASGYPHGCKLLEPYGKNEFIMLVEDAKILRLDWQSNIKWIKRGWFHHDIAVAENGTIYTLMNKIDNFPEINPDSPILDNLIVVFAPDGTIKKEYSFAKMIVANNTQPILHLAQQCKYRQAGASEVFDTNSLQIIDRDIFQGSKRLFKKGDVLFSMKSLDLIGVVDLEKEIVVWCWGQDELDAQHHPTLLKNGNILIFDNGRRRRKYSRVIEVNPKTDKIEWEYKADPPSRFFSPSRGAVQRLPNGNTLITESTKGHVFEITPAGKIVWEFWNPSVARKKKRGTIYRMTRYDNNMWGN